MKSVAHHVESLDVFRGITVAAMIVVNNPGDWGAVYGPLLHAYWTGWTFADLVYPWFIFMMGVAMPFAFSRRGANRSRRASGPMYRRILRRVTFLVGLGLALNAVAAWPVVSPLRYPGVLQRIALAYLIAAPVVLHLEVTGWALAIVVLMVAHAALLAYVPFDGHAAGTLLPEQNLARYVDRLIFGVHAFAKPTDPEGLLGTLTAVATALCGAVAGRVLRQDASNAARAAKLVGGGIATAGCGLIWANWLPLSKPLWTGPFVLLTSGLAAVILAAIYVVVDVGGLRAWARPFVWLGVNALAIYFLSEVVGHLQAAPKAWIYWTILEPAMPRTPELASLVFAVAFAVLWIGVAGLLYRAGIRVQV